MTTLRHGLLAVVSFATFVIALALPRTAAAQQDHRYWAQLVVDQVRDDRNDYASPSQVTWRGVNGAKYYSTLANCSGFLTRVLQQAYGWTDTDMSLWMGRTAPLAEDYHDTIVAGDGFTRVLAVDQIAASDIIAIRYPEGSAVSGHVAIALSAATLRATATAPLVSGTSQYEITVLDSSTSGHGPTDTRLASDGTWNQGAGVGVMRLYADASLNIVGYTWSTYTASVYRDSSTHSLVIGRL